MSRNTFVSHDQIASKAHRTQANTNFAVERRKKLVTHNDIALRHLFVLVCSDRRRRNHPLLSLPPTTLYPLLPTWGTVVLLRLRLVSATLGSGQREDAPRCPPLLRCHSRCEHASTGTPSSLPPSRWREATDHFRSSSGGTAVKGKRVRERLFRGERFERVDAHRRPRRQHQKYLMSTPAGRGGQNASFEKSESQKRRGETHRSNRTDELPSDLCSRRVRLG
jgi:hypothetical protein